MMNRTPRPSKVQRLEARIDKLVADIFKMNDKCVKIRRGLEAEIRTLKAENENLHKEYQDLARIHLGLAKASDKLGAWMSAALEDDKVCDEMKVDIREWFEALPKRESQ